MAKNSSTKKTNSTAKKTTANKTQVYTDAELNQMYERICSDLDTLHEQSEKKMGTARILFCALGAYLMQNETLADLYLVGTYVYEHRVDESDNSRAKKIKTPKKKLLKRAA